MLAKIENLQYKRPMNIGYGLRRREKTLRDAGAERVYLDPDHHRTELAFICDPDNYCLRDGDVLIVVDLADLGHRPQALIKRLAKRGVSVKVQGEAGKRVPHPKSGRPRDKFDPTPDQWTDIKAIWTGKFTLPHKLAEIQIIMGRPIKPWLVRDFKGFPGPEEND